MVCIHLCEADVKFMGTLNRSPKRLGRFSYRNIGRWPSFTMVIEQQDRARSTKIPQDQLLGGHYADLQRQSRFDDHTLVLCQTATLNAWDRVEKLYKTQKKPSLLSYKD